MVLELREFFFAGAIHWSTGAKLVPSSTYVLSWHPVLRGERTEKRERRERRGTEKLPLVDPSLTYE